MSVRGRSAGPWPALKRRLATRSLRRQVATVRLGIKMVQGFLAFQGLFADAKAIADEIGHKLEDCFGLNERAAVFVKSKMYRNLTDGKSGRARANHDLGIGKPIVRLLYT